MKISIITVVYNNVGHIASCVKSVISQSHYDIEYIVIDGKSTDGTLEVVNRYKEKITKIVSESDKGHIYAMNKGLDLSTGDIVGFLHSDDFYTNEKVIEKVANRFKNTSLDSLYGDLVYVKRNNPEKAIRYWQGGVYNRDKIRRGWMPPHPTFFVRKEIYKKYGYFNTSFKISMDYEIALRFLEKYKISTHYIPEILVKMRAGGVSNKGFRNIILKSLEDYKAYKMCGATGGFSAIMSKNLIKIPQFFNRKTRKD